MLLMLSHLLYFSGTHKITRRQINASMRLGQNLKYPVGFIYFSGFVVVVVYKKNLGI